MKPRKYIIFALLALAIVALIVVDCQRNAPVKPAHSTTLRGEAMGTFYQLTVRGDLPLGFEARLDSLFDAANGSMSIFNPASLISRINRGETDTADLHIAKCIELAHHASSISDGAYDITIRPLVVAYGFAGENPEFSPNVDSLLEFVGYEKLSLEGLRIVKGDPRMTIDLNSVAKGMAVDMLADLVRSEGIEDFLVDIGGEIYCQGDNAYGQRWAIGVETPFEGNYSLSGEHITKVLRMSGAGMATSGNYRNFRTDSLGNKFTHIINPITGENTSSSLLSATVVAESCALADTYGTMFISLGLEKAKQVALNNHIAALFIYDDGGKMRIFSTPEMAPWLD